jgi:putative ABC transport system substrate-binding protein
MELLLKAVPSLGKVAVLMNPGNAIYATYRSRAESAARAARLRPLPVDATTYRDIENAFKSLAAQSVGGFVVMSDGTFYTERNTITELAARYRIPAVYPQRAYVESGGLISYGQSYEFNYVRAATYVDRILKGREAGATWRSRSLPRTSSS